MGIPFTGVGRAMNMGIISFGRDVTWVDKRTGEEMTGGEYAIHAQCPFRFSISDRIILGSGDVRWRSERGRFRITSLGFR
jgi:hypothetical protein